MALLLLLFLQLLLHLQPGCGSGSSPSIFRTTYTAVSEPGQGLPQFTAAAYVDDRPIARYDSNTRRLLLQASWMVKLLEENPEYWDKYTQMLQQDEADFIAGLMPRQTSYYQSTGFHTWQMMAGCEVGLGGKKGRYLQFGSDGRDYLSLDMESLTWTAADAIAQITKRKWEADSYISNRFKTYVEETCAELLQGMLDYGKERLQRREPPEMIVTRKAGYDDMETLTCRAHGFYPKEIDMDWTRDEEVWVQDTFRGVLAPNSDGTYHAWLSVKINPQDRERYRCRVEHDGLLTPMELAWEKTGASNLGLIIGFILGVALLVLAAVLAWKYVKKFLDAYRPASEIIQESYEAAKRKLKDDYSAAEGKFKDDYHTAKKAAEDDNGAAEPEKLLNGNKAESGSDGEANTSV